MIRSATTRRSRCGAKAPGSKHRTGAELNCMWLLPVPVAAMTGNVSWRFLPEPLRATVCANLPRLGGSWDYRCAAHEYRMAAGGHCHFAVFQPADAMGPRAGLAAASRGRRVFGSARWQCLSPDANRRRLDLHAGSGELGGVARRAADRSWVSHTKRIPPRTRRNALRFSAPLIIHMRGAPLNRPFPGLMQSAQDPP